ncbi:MAG: F0F1 ATP synthase subunit alpha, partial [Lachnospiraceae bacterium]|nr:F0F1 ATP synthase subunit alpha [Lachnospiraceae bacterium]
LKQNQNSPIPVEKQIAIIYAVTKNILAKVAVTDVKEYESGLYTFLDTDADGAAFMDAVKSTGKLEEDTENKLKSALERYTDEFVKTHTKE